MLTISIIVAILLIGAGVLVSKKKKKPTTTTNLTLHAVSLSSAPAIRSALKPEAVIVKFGAVEIKPEEGKSLLFTFDQPKQVDLLALPENANALLDGVEVPAGKYEWVRLKAITDKTTFDSHVKVGPDLYPLWIPSGDTSGLKLTQGFVMPANEPANFFLDFDADKSLKAPPGLSGSFIMRPTIKLVDNYVPPVEEPPVEGGSPVEEPPVEV